MLSIIQFVSCFPFSTNILQSSSIDPVVRPILLKKYRSLVEYRSLVQGYSMHKGTACMDPMLSLGFRYHCSSYRIVGILLFLCQLMISCFLTFCFVKPAIKHF